MTRSEYIEDLLLNRNFISPEDIQYLLYIIDRYKSHVEAALDCLNHGEMNQAAMHLESIEEERE